MRRFFPVLLTLASLGCAQSANAQSSAPVYLGGRLTQSAASRGQYALAIGFAAQAIDQQASVRDGAQVRGDANLSASGGEQIALALGAFARAQTLVADVGAGRTNSVRAAGYAGEALSLSFVPGADTCVAVGSVAGDHGDVSTRAGVGTAVAYDIGFWSHSKIRVGTVGKPC